MKHTRTYTLLALALRVYSSDILFVHQGFFKRKGNEVKE